MKSRLIKERYVRGSLIPVITQVLWGFAFLCLCFTCFLIIQELRHLSDRKSTNGEVISYVESHETARFHPKIRFKDQQGIVHDFIDGTGATAPLYVVGTIVQVDYHPLYPNIAEMTTLYYRWGSSFAVLSMATLCWFMGSRFTYRVKT